MIEFEDETRDGTKVRIYARDGVNNMIHGATLEENGWVIRAWRQSGSFYMDMNYPKDLMPKKVLKPCPFCGKDAAKVMSPIDNDELSYIYQDGWSVVCDASGRGGKGGCGAVSGWSADEETARKSWNRRVK